MYILEQLSVAPNRRIWTLVDTTTNLPLLFPLLFLIDRLSLRSESTQSSTFPQVMQQMGINGQISPFSPQSATGDSMNAFHGGLCNGLQAPAMPGTFAQLPASISGNNASSSYNQLGNTMGSQLANNMGLQALDNVTADTGGLSFNGGGKVDGGTTDSWAQIGKFMDQHPEIYGKPQGDGSSSGKIADAGKSPSRPFEERFFVEPYLKLHCAEITKTEGIMMPTSTPK
ncbi:hypothetical protein [Cedecea neteri]|uniref:hypothetical protein n=1 Tax=Cedecea neteri TaxID=158822 RepID=UPI00068C6044|nr:hypothetical protein [Cedecea neteri]